MKRSVAQAFDAVLRVTGLDSLCAQCGGITQQSKPVLIIGAGEELRACDTCGLWLDQDGRPAGGRDAEGEVVLGVVVVHGTMAREPEMPGQCGVSS
jgi:hypothetical protein